MNKDYLIETIPYKGYTIEIGYDYFPESPRSWDNLGTCSFNHRRYDFGDEKAPKFETSDEFYDFIKKENGVYLNVYMYDHSGITISTKPFNDRWDSGLLGFIYATAEDIKKEFGNKRISRKLRNKVRSILRGEIETLDKYICNDVYRYCVTNDKGVYVDSCCGFYDKADAISEAKSSVDSDIESKDQQLELPFAA